MRIKMTALALSALLPLSVWAMPGQGQGQQGQQAQGQQSQKGQQGQKNQQTKMQARQEMMQQRQAAWFDRLELNAEQRQAFQKEMQQHYQQQQKTRTAHHDKLRALLTDEQRVIFDQDTAKRQQRMFDYMKKADKSPRSGEKKRDKRTDTTQ
jgi:hypothetical protein